MTKKIENILDKFIIGVQEILEKRLKKIILYGSYARGDYNIHSDIDIMILTDLNDVEIPKYRSEIASFAYDIELENDIIISPVIKNIDSYNYWLEVQPFYQNVQSEGIVLK